MHAAPEELTHVCENIGPAERKKRNQVGVIFSALTLLTAALLVETHVGWPLRLLIAVPASIAALGFLQARAHTCVAFVGANVKVMGDARSKVEVTDEAERAAFRKKARTIYAQGAGVTAVVVALFLLLP